LDELNLEMVIFNLKLLMEHILMKSQLNQNQTHFDPHFLNLNLHVLWKRNQF
jgi:hypothetical protein